MSLDALDTQLDDLREQASNLQRSTQREKRNIAADPSLSEDGKRQQTEEVISTAKSRAKTLREKEV
ncbi:hypothetical protein [Curtobacterium flaccumfaciens]|uniref:hypothetical protein n=1 Tax=Curtobacterium flaccumfaciens TaxID=2035 RepID=UPI0020326AFD|nr:hypothetical protein [Curtobacterium flaccumfaciens]MCX2796816.1 hypothetical protein [Curtobacterium flaccumfaciens pv. flaccumfaciens]